MKTFSRLAIGVVLAVAVTVVAKSAIDREERSVRLREETQKLRSLENKISVVECTLDVMGTSEIADDVRREYPRLREEIEKQKAVVNSLR